MQKRLEEAITAKVVRKSLIISLMQVLSVSRFQRVKKMAQGHAVWWGQHIGAEGIGERWM